MKKIIYVFAILVTTVACENKQQKVLKQKEADSIVNAALLLRDGDRAIALADSFEKTSDISLINASMLRGKAYIAKNMLAESEAEFKKAMEGTPKNLPDSICYFTSVCNVVQHQALHMDYEAILNTALPMIETLNNFKYPKEYAPDILFQKMMLYTYLGHAQKNLDKDAEAEKTYEHVYRISKELMEASDSWNAYFNSAIVLHQVVLNNLAKKNYNRAAYWMARADSLAPVIYEHKEMLDAYKAIIKTNYDGDHMNLAIGLKKMDEAEHYFEEFRKTDFSKTADGQYWIIEFYLASHRYAEAADAFMATEAIFAKYNRELSLDYMSILAKKYEANLKAGRRDSALATATFAFENLDSAIVREKSSEAAKLATIYETKQKDEEIAQQQIELSRQRFLALAVALVLITVFFIVYTLFRRRAAKRLAEMKAAQERIESELRIARDIQMSMVPSSFPEIEGLDLYGQMTPAKEVGGDLFGYVINGNNLYFTVGDVSGKGVPASLFMAQATRLFRAMADQGLMPAEICTNMNTQLSGEDNTNGMFVTMFLGMLDMESGHLHFCNAGHNPPILGGGASQGEFIEMEPNAPIGLFPGLDYEGEEIESIKGRAMFIYTDGLNEAEDAEQNQFGDDKLLEILREINFNSARQVVETLAIKVEEHRKGAEPNDDLTMLCLRVD